MSGVENRKLRATFTFTPTGDLEDVFLLVDNDQEETILRQAIAPALKVLEWRRLIKRALLWIFNHGLLPQKVTQGLFDFFRLRSV